MKLQINIIMSLLKPIHLNQLWPITKNWDDVDFGAMHFVDLTCLWDFKGSAMTNLNAVATVKWHFLGTKSTDVELSYDWAKGKSFEGWKVNMTSLALNLQKWLNNSRLHSFVRISDNFMGK